MSRQGNEPEYYDVTKGDAEMKHAVREARKNVGTFIAALQHPTAAQRDFEVKKPFMQGNDVEYIWLAGVTYSGNRFHGYVDNKPVKIKGLKLGQRVSVNPDEISDWAFIDNGKLVGGYTIRVMCATCDPDARERMEKAGRFRVESE